jgi:hypothetical protein
MEFSLLAFTSVGGTIALTLAADPERRALGQMFGGSSG